MTNSTEAEILYATIPAELAGKRLDQAVATLFPDYSRSRLQTWIKAGQLRVDGATARPRDKVAGGEALVLVAEAEPDQVWQAEPLVLDVIYEDEGIIVVNKPAGLVTHPAVGNWSGTLLNALLHHAPELEALPRAGIVHRLDKETSGLLVIARTLAAHKHLVDALAQREVGREYVAVVHGLFVAGGTVDAPIGRHRIDRKRMAVVTGGKPAVTHYRVAERFRAHTCLAVRLETGRTHQIRVHMAHVQHPLVGDPVYGGRPRLPKGCDDALRASLEGFRRQALHAARLELEHPLSGAPMVWEAPLPEDLVELLAQLRADRAAHPL